MKIKIEKSTGNTTFVDEDKNYFNDDVFDQNNESYLEITINDNALYSNAAIKMQINNIFNNYFK